jgi:transcriptional antiterminator
MSLKGLKPQDFRPDQLSDLKSINHQLESTASKSFESPNYFSVLSDSDLDTESAESTPPSPSRKERIPPILLYSYLNNHSQMLKSLSDKLSRPIDVKTKKNWLLLNTKRKWIMRYSCGK